MVFITRAPRVGSLRDPPLSEPPLRQEGSEAMPSGFWFVLFERRPEKNNARLKLDANAHGYKRTREGEKSPGKEPKTKCRNWCAPFETAPRVKERAGETCIVRKE